jgi:PAS domain S-box-containing protein
MMSSERDKALPSPNQLCARADNTNSDAPRWVSRAWWIAGTYGVFAMLWIYFSDRALATFLPDPAVLIRWSVVKGLVFVAVTSLLLLWLMRRSFAAVESSYVSLRTQEKQLRASEEQLAAIIRSAMDAIVTADTAGRVILFNAAAEKMFRCDAANALGQSLESFIPAMAKIADRTATVPAAPQSARLANRSPEEPTILVGRHLAGDEFPVEASVSQHEANGQHFFTIVLRDITVRQNQQAEIGRLNRLNSALSHINQAIVRISRRDELLQRVCDILVENGGFCLAWAGWHDEEKHVLEPVAVAGDANDYVQTITIYTDDRATGRRPSGTAFRADQSFICNDILADPFSRPTLDEATRRGFRAYAAFPIHHQGKAAGLLSVYAGAVGFFQDKEITLLQEAAANLSFALGNLAREEERQRVEAIARNEKLFSDTLLESMPGVLYLYDDQGRFLRWNQNVERVSGFAAEDVARMSPMDFIAPADRAAIEASVKEVFAVGESSVESALLTRDGKSVPYFFTGRRVLFNGVACLVGVGIDISERKRAEVALRELNETLEQQVADRTGELQRALTRAEASDRIKSAFLATMSHELRTPLNSIIGFTGIVLQGLAGPLNAEQTKQLGMVRLSARHLLELINDVLDLSKIEAGQLEVAAEPFHLLESIERVVASVTPLANKKGLILTTRAPSDLGEMVSDRRRVEQILLNLLNNALKFTVHGSVTLSVEPVANSPSTPDAEPTRAIRIRVIDTGIGIKEADLATLFQPFRQIDSGLSRQHDGTGLGLAICRRLTHLMGGRISAQSQWSQGSEFTVTLPLKPPTAP